MSNAQSTPDISSSTPLEDLEFWGRPNEVVSRFLGAIMRAAIIQGRHSDEGWMVAYTESCLRGDALEWFDNTSADVAKMEWSSLRKALLCRFHRPDPYMASPPPSAVATGGTVVAATEAAVAGATEASMSRCQVKVVKSNGQVLGYIPPPDRSSTSFVPVSSENALVLIIPKVHYGNQALAPIRMVAQSETFPFLGIEKRNDVVWALRPCRVGRELNSGKHTLTDSKHEGRPASSTIWMVKTLYDCTEVLCAVWADEKAQAPLQAYLNSSSYKKVYIQTRPDPGEEKVMLVLERF
ncbi:hypothetical protein FRB95_003195 [Tulasnella sp. JGI-2019a]|nr:hypothetical protein FRB95_003195 [Tulasnella sp. JGI-2019a]